ncbi:helix-turn-helix DNA-binding domain protein [Gordonia phage ODay]|nr:helix-turn-helix DNA-binding domain protein [Gordonia phage ODay]
MRIRSIKPDFWRSPDITHLDIPERLLFIGLWSYVDDNGVGQDRVSTVAADLFADDLERDPRETLARITGGLAKLSEANRIIRYTVENRDFLYIVNWNKHQRIDKPNKPRYPLPTSENAAIREGVAEPSRESRGIPAPGAGEQGSRGTEESLSAYVSEREGTEKEKPANYRMITLPDDWAPNDLHRAKFPTLDIDAEAEAFRDRQNATGRLCNGRAGWDAAFNSWLRESKKRSERPDDGKPKHKLRALADMTRAAEANEQANTLPTTDQRAITG